MTSSDPARSVAGAHAQFLELVDAIRPELHRYCARLTGSVIEGEDIVQDTLAKAFYALGQMPETPPLRPWLFRIAHNAALDYLKSHSRRRTDLYGDVAEAEGAALADEAPDPIAVRAALAHFVALPVSQRSAVILKDVLGHSLEETAETMGASILSVKALLVRGRAKLAEVAREGAEIDPAARAGLERYATLFNARDWDGLRALIADDCRLDLVSKSQRRGKEVGMYFGNYAKLDVRLRLARVDGEVALAAFLGASDAPAYFIQLGFDGDRVATIRDYRYVPYIAKEASVEYL